MGGPKAHEKLFNKIVPLSPSLSPVGVSNFSQQPPWSLFINLSLPPEKTSEQGNEGGCVLPGAGRIDSIRGMVKGKKLKWGKKNGLLLVGLALAGVALLTWLALGSLDWEDPWVEAPDQLAVAGSKAAFTFKAGDRDSGLKDLKVKVKQGDGPERVVLARTFPPGGEAGTVVEVPITLEPKTLGLKEGKASLTVTAVDRSWRNFFSGRSTSLTRDLEVDLVPLTVSFVSVSHLLQAGGTGLIIYRVNKTPRESGVRLGGHFSPGHPVPKGQTGVYGALFFIPQDASGLLAAEIVARGAVGSETKQSVSLRLKPKKWRHDQMKLSEGFLRQVASTFPEADQGDLLKTFLEVNRKMRQANHDKVRRVTAGSQPQPLWSGAFLRYHGKSMARFGDRRTYLWQNRAVDEQVHLGEDLASLIHSPVPAGNNGVVVLAEPLGIYGNTVIVDHGLGVSSMYSHLSKFEVKAGDRVEKGQVLGRTGTTGLAGGDHLHFGVIIHGEFVNPVEWWDAHWFKDQVEKLWAQAATPTAAAATDRPKKSQDASRTPKSKKGQKRR